MTGTSAGRETTLVDTLAADLLAYRGGDRAAMTDLVQRATPVLWNVARGIGVDRAAAEDAVQNALLALVRHAEEISDPRAVLRWLIVTTQREAVRFSRAARRIAPTPDAGEHLLAAAGDSPESIAVANHSARVLWRNVAQLPERCRRLLRVIAFAERPDYATLSAALGMPAGSIGPTRGRCLAKLRTLLSADPEWEAA
ncbi:MAG TPA: sigma-70 family RNA polymerase sigma factor [Pseudonocardiaceae bacterium]|jgi:RNA polymerase sigma factor (sigma-70 family)|nr:sigma-70 family RNA polymerase sigma factor [Pseudonocardiaceae bacterium]